MRLALLALLLLVAAGTGHSQSSSLEDVTGDGTVTYVGFGDSITFGVGDGTQPGDFVEDPPPTDGSAGYLLRLRQLLGILTANEGVPGEELAATGAGRFPGTALAVPGDIYGIFEGANDAVRQLRTSEYRRLIQRTVNVSEALGRTTVLFTVPPPCCNRAGPEIFTGAYSSAARDIAAANGILLADIERAWTTTCSSLSECDLYNLPEGLHPNSKGYDVIGQTVAAALLGIDIFSPTGAAELESALGLPAGTVVVKPDL